MKKVAGNTLLSLSLALAGFLVGGWFFGDPSGRHSKARDVVSEVKEKLLEYYESTGEVPNDLRLISDSALAEKIEEYSITFDAESRLISSTGNWTYTPSLLFRLTFGHFGDPRASSVGNPGHDLSRLIPPSTDKNGESG